MARSGASAQTLRHDTAFAIQRGHLGRVFARQLERAWLRRGALAFCLQPVAWIMGAVVAMRRAAYRHRWLRSERLPVPVVVVGNLIVGGAGKTPTVAALVALLQRNGWRPGIVSRGHGRRGSAIVDVTHETAASLAGDEPVLLRRRCGCPVVVGRDRVAAGHALLRLHPEVDVVVSDDGLQHLRLARDLQVLVFDERGIGNGWILPAGPLREPVPARCPAHSLVLYNAVAPSMSWPGSMVGRRLGGAVRLADWWAGHPATTALFDTLRQHAGSSTAHPVAAAGVGQPGRFFDMLAAAGIAAAPLPLPDHHAYDGILPWPRSADPVIVTEKDAVKLDPRRDGTQGVWVVPLNFEFEPGFSRTVLDHLHRSSTRKTPTA